MSKHSKLSQFLPFFDSKDKVIKSQTRLGIKKPGDLVLTILPKGSKAVELFVLHIHESNLHSGAESTLAKIFSAGYLLMGGRRQLKILLHKCPNHRCVKPPLFTQRMCPLPLSHQEGHVPWGAISLDHFGPCHIRTYKGKLDKIWGLIITDYYSRSTHLEVCESLSVEHFLYAFRTFCAIRGKPRYCYSDNSKMFRFGRKELIRVINYGTENDIQWEFSPAHAPWFNSIVINQALQTDTSDCSWTFLHQYL